MQALCLLSSTVADKPFCRNLTIVVENPEKSVSTTTDFTGN
jgi:hypothetical protein